MKRILEVCLVVLAFAINPVPTGGAQSGPTTTDRASFAGTWESRMNDLPGVTLKITEAGGNISGSIVFYMQERADVNSPWHVTGEYRVPLLTVRVTGNTLFFEAEHHVCHGCPEFGPNVVFRMELTGANSNSNEARLFRLEKDGTESQMKLLRATGASTQPAPPMQAGISVQMPVTRNAAPMPEADQEDAVILTVTGDGKIYLGVSQLDPNALADELQRSLATRGEKAIYIKADARAPYATIVHVLDAARAAGVETPILLTTQQAVAGPGTLVSPKGLRVMLGQLSARAEQLR